MIRPQPQPSQAREAYSAKDQRQHEGLVQLWSEMKPGVGYCRMVTITTNDPLGDLQLPLRG